MKITIDIETEAGGDACFTTVAPESPTLGGPLVDLKQLRSVLDDMVVRAMRSYGAVPDETEEARPIDAVRPDDERHIVVADTVAEAKGFAREHLVFEKRVITATPENVHEAFLGLGANHPRLYVTGDISLIPIASKLDRWCRSRGVSFEALLQRGSDHLATNKRGNVDGARLYGGVVDEVENFSESTRGNFSTSQRDEGC